MPARGQPLSSYPTAISQKTPFLPLTPQNRKEVELLILYLSGRCLPHLPARPSHNSVFGEDGLFWDGGV